MCLARPLAQESLPELRTARFFSRLSLKELNGYIGVKYDGLGYLVRRQGYGLVVCPELSWIELDWVGDVMEAKELTSTLRLARPGVEATHPQGSVS